MTRTNLNGLEGFCLLCDFRTSRAESCPCGFYEERKNATKVGRCCTYAEIQGVHVVMRKKLVEVNGDVYSRKEGVRIMEAVAREQEY